jgi:hypothetical protein
MYGNIENCKLSSLSCQSSKHRTVIIWLSNRKFLTSLSISIILTLLN